MSSTPVVIGVAGGSGSGKTTVVRRIVESMGTDHVIVLASCVSTRRSRPITSTNGIPGLITMGFTAVPIAPARSAHPSTHPIYRTKVFSSANRMMLGRNIFKLRLSCLKSEPDSPRLAILASCCRRSRLLLVFGKRRQPHS